MKPMIKTISILTAFSALLLPITSFAKGLHEIYNLDSVEAPALIVNPSGLIFLGKNLGIYRTYDWKQTPLSDVSRPVYVVDLDLDGKPEIIGAGKPTFVLNNEADPVWIHHEGCDQLLVGDFAADEKLDLACIHKNKVRISTNDNQMIWELNLGRRIVSCNAEDLNGDQKLDLECKTGKNSFSRIDGTDGRIIGMDSNEEKMTHKYTPTIKPVRPISKDAPPAKLTAVQFKGTPLGLLEKDLNADGFIEFTVLTDKEIVVKNGNPDAETKQKTYTSRAKAYKRFPVATLEGAYVMNFQNGDDAGQRAHAIKKPLSKCYAGAVKKSAFAGSGRIILKATVNDKAKVTNVQKIHSSIADSKVVDCATKIVKNTDFGPAKEGANADVNLTILYSFQSQ